MEREFILCDCGAVEHQMLLCYAPGEREERLRTMWVEVHLGTWRGFFGRLWAGLRYAFGHRSRYGEWDCVELNRESVRGLRDFAQGYLDAFGEDSDEH